MAAMNLKSPSLKISQFCDRSVTFENTCNMLCLYDPVEIILPTTLNNSKLSDLLKQEFPNSQVNFVARKLFNETKGDFHLFPNFQTGHVLIKQLVVKENSSVLTECSMKYLSVSACAALLDHIENTQGITIAPASLNICYTPCSGYMMISTSTIQNLEIISNIRTGTTQHTLFATVQHTKTPMGNRLLRASLLQPLTGELQLRC
jgi:DNA mismatch repair protein MSH4